MSDVAAMESASLEARGEALGLPSGVIVALLVKYGPTLVKLLLDLLAKKEESGFSAPGDAGTFKAQLARVLELAEYGAKLTKTETDDMAVAVARQIVENSTLVEFVFFLLGK